MRTIRILLKYLIVAPVCTVVIGWCPLLLAAVEWVLTDTDYTMRDGAKVFFKYLWTVPAKQQTDETT